MQFCENYEMDKAIFILSIPSPRTIVKGNTHLTFLEIKLEKPFGYADKILETKKKIQEG